MRFWEATGFQHMLDRPVRKRAGSASAPSFVAYDYHGIRSEEIGPVRTAAYDELTVRDGEIVDVFGYIEIAMLSPQMWEPFAEWVSTNYPEDVAVMYKSDFSDYQLTPESIRLWEQHTREYKEAAQGTADVTP